MAFQSTHLPDTMHTARAIIPHDQTLPQGQADLAKASVLVMCFGGVGYFAKDSFLLRLLGDNMNFDSQVKLLRLRSTTD